MEQVCALETLASGYRKVKGNAKSTSKRRRAIERFGLQLEENLTRLSQTLKKGDYKPKPYKRQMVPKANGGERPLSISEIPESIVLAALLLVLEPKFEPTFSDSSYGFRKGRGPTGALNRVIELLNEGYAALVDADIEKFFDTIPRQQLLDKVGEKVTDVRVTKLIWAFLTAGYMQDGQFYEQELGTPQGAAISPLLANIYLNPMDRWITAQGPYELVRYADDFVILCRTMKEAEAALDLTRSWMQSVGLCLQTEKTWTRETKDGFNFLGFYFKGKEVRLPRQERVEHLIESILAATTRSKKSMAEMIKMVNDAARGWYDYYQLSTDPQPFRELDNLIQNRMGWHGSRPSMGRELVQLDSKNRRVFSLAESYASKRHAYHELTFNRG